jgi:ADP-ribose pyrophosphatase YjhB (NUDIX family)
MSKVRCSINSDDRRYPLRPILGVGAIIIEGGRVLLVKRAREPLKGWWSLPGGVLETGERLRDGVRREVREETGLVVEPHEVVEIFERILHDGEGRVEYHYVLIDYLCRVTEGALCAADDVCDAAWISRPELGAYRVTEGSLQVIEKAFEIAG